MEKTLRERVLRLRGMTKPPCAAALTLFLRVAMSRRRVALSCVRPRSSPRWLCIAGAASLRAASASGASPTEPHPPPRRAPPQAGTPRTTARAGYPIGDRGRPVSSGLPCRLLQPFRPGL